MAFLGADGKQFMSSVLAKASMPGGYTRTITRPSTTITRTNLSNLARSFGNDYEQAREEQQKRYKSGLGDLAQAAGLFGPDYGKGMEEVALTGARQTLIGRGLGGSTRPQAVSAGIKAQFEDLRRGRLSEALTRMAEYRRTSPQIYPSPGTIAGLATNVVSGGFQERELLNRSTQPIHNYPDINYGSSNVPRIDFALPSGL